MAIGALAQRHPGRQAARRLACGVQPEDLARTAGWVTTPTTRERITTAIGLILTAGARAGPLRGDVHPEDATAILLGIFLSTPAHANSQQTGRLLALVLDALRPPPHT